MASKTEASWSTPFSVTGFDTDRVHDIALEIQEALTGAKIILVRRDGFRCRVIFTFDIENAAISPAGMQRVLEFFRRHGFTTAKSIWLGPAGGSLRGSLELWCSVS